MSTPLTVTYKWSEDSEKEEGTTLELRLGTDDVKKHHEWPVATVSVYTEAPQAFYARILCRTDPDDGYTETFASLEEAKKFVEDFLFGDGVPAT